MARCSGDTALYAIRRWTLTLYSTRMDRGGTPGQVTELFQVALKKAVISGLDQCGFFESWYVCKFWQPTYSTFKYFLNNKILILGVSLRNIPDRISGNQLYGR